MNIKKIFLATLIAVISISAITLSANALSLAPTETHIATGACFGCTSTGETIDLADFDFNDEMPIHVTISVVKGDGSDHFDGSAKFDLSGLELHIFAEQEALGVKWLAIQTNEANVASGLVKTGTTGEVIDLSGEDFDDSDDIDVFIGITAGDGSDHFDGSAQYELDGTDLKIFTKEESLSISWLAIQSDTLNIASGRCENCPQVGESIDLTEHDLVQDATTYVMFGITAGDGSDHFDGTALAVFKGVEDLNVSALTERLDVNWLAIQKVLGVVGPDGDDVEEDYPEGKPIITRITPSFGEVGTMVRIEGSELAGFEGDLIAVFERGDGKTTKLYDNDTRGDGVINVSVKEPCQEGEIIYQPYSGIQIECDYMEFTPGIYKVYTEPWGKRSNTVNFTLEAEDNDSSEDNEKPEDVDPELHLPSDLPQVPDDFANLTQEEQLETLLSILVALLTQLLELQIQALQ